MQQARNQQTTQLRKQQKQSVWCLLYLMLPTHPALSIALFCTVLATQSQLQTENITWKILQVGSLFSVRAIFKSVIKSSYPPASSCSGQEPSSWPLCLPTITVSLWVLLWLQCEMSPTCLCVWMLCYQQRVFARRLGDLYLAQPNWRKSLGGHWGFIACSVVPDCDSVSSYLRLLQPCPFTIMAVRRPPTPKYMLRNTCLDWRVTVTIKFPVL